METDLAMALRPVLRDLGTVRSLTAQVLDDQWASTPGQLSARLANATDRTSMGIYVMAADSEVQRIVSLADQVQEWAVEALWRAGLPATWPECPLHPGSHPLRAATIADEAVWICPKLDQEIAAIGSL